MGWSLRTRFLRRSTARCGQSRNHSLQLERTRLYVKSRRVFFLRRSQKFTRHSTRFPHARYIGTCEKGRERRRRAARAAHALTCASAYARPRQLESQMLPPPPQPPPVGRAAGGLRLRARRPTPRRLLPLGAGVRAFHFTPRIYADSPTEGGRLKRRIVGWSLRTRFLRRSAARGGQSRNHTPNLRNQRRTRAAIRKIRRVF